MLTNAPHMMFSVPSKAILLLALFTPTHAQSTSTLQGRVLDPNGAVIPHAKIVISSAATKLEREAETDSTGNYQLSGLSAGTYRVEVQSNGFPRQVMQNLTLDVARTVLQDFHLTVGDITQEVVVTADAPMIELATSSVGQVINQRTVQEIPLNGRYFLDLAQLVPGSVTPSQSGFSTTPSRGVGALAVNTAGNREETVNYLINGITVNNLAFSAIGFQPSISSIREFKMDNSGVSAEYGQSSGAIVNIATRSGTSQFHGDVFEFLRNDVFDARNFFNFTSDKPPPFKRNQFGGTLGGPMVKGKTFFFFSYEGLRQRQGVDLNSLVLCDAERASVTDPGVAKLVNLIPSANFVDSSGACRFVGSAAAPTHVDQWTLDISHNLSARHSLHGYYAMQNLEIIEPNRSGNTIPGFGHRFDARRQIFTLSDTRSSRGNVVNETRLGFTRFFGTATPNAQLNPNDFGIHDGINRDIGLPQLSVAGGLNLGGPANQPVGRGDTTFVVSDNLNKLQGNHSLKFGGEFRKFLSNNFALDTGRFNFPSVDGFISGTANSFSITLGDRASSIAEGALAFFAQDNYRWRSNVMFELGVRYEWNMTPSERYDRFIVFDPLTASLLRVGEGRNSIYPQNNKNFQPRVGLAWDPFNDGRTSLRVAYAIVTDQPMTSVVAPTASNPPLAVPLTFSGPIRLGQAIDRATAAGLAPQTVAENYRNAYLQSWNLNLQRELTSNLGLMIGYFGSKGTHLILRRNINQPVNGVRPYRTLSSSSAVFPGAPLGNITQAESTGASSYNALWIALNRRLSRGLQFSFSYTWSKSLDYNSLSSQGVVVQDSYNLREDRGLSDFDARHRFVGSLILELPFKGSWFVEGWQLASIVQLQSGNPVNIVSSNSTINGVPNTVRPDVTAPVTIIGKVDRWFDTSVFLPVGGFGNLGRNVIIGPGFSNIDLSVRKNTTLTERLVLQGRVEVFNLFNHTNLGQPGNIVGTPNFGRITNTRFPTGEFGSSRQLQFALRISF